MKALVTGGTGFVGGSIVSALLAAGNEVRVLARPQSRVEHLTDLGVEIASGDVLDRNTIVAALVGCDTLFHAAAPFDFWIPKPSVMRTTGAGTRNALDAALEVGLAKVVYTSAASTIGERRGETGDERTRHRGYHVSLYERTEYEAEVLAATYLDRGLPLVIVNPASVYGPGNFKPVGRAIINVLNGRIPARFSGAVTYVYIDDAGAGHLLAATRGRVGERYILADRVVTMDEWFATVCRLGGIRLPPRIPIPVARVVAEAGEAAARFTGRPPMLPRDLLKICAHGFRVDGGRAGRELGVVYTDFEEGMRRTITWYWTQGQLNGEPLCVKQARLRSVA